MKLQCVWAIVLFFVRAGRYMHISIDFVMVRQFDKLRVYLICT